MVGRVVDSAALGPGSRSSPPADVTRPAFPAAASSVPAADGSEPAALRCRKPGGKGMPDGRRRPAPSSPLAAAPAEPAGAASSVPPAFMTFGFLPDGEPGWGSPSVVDEELTRDLLPGAPSRRAQIK
jgi:hypothetical protein